MNEFKLCPFLAVHRLFAVSVLAIANYLFIHASCHVARIEDSGHEVLHRVSSDTKPVMRYQ